MANINYKIIAFLLFSLVILTTIVTAEVMFETRLECQNRTEKIYDGFEIIGTNTIEYKANLTTYEATNGSLRYVTIRSDCSLYGDYTTPESNLSIGYCYELSSTDAECRTRMEYPPSCKVAGESLYDFFDYSGEEGWYDICYREDQTIAHNINGYGGCANGNPMIDATGCVKEGEIDYIENTCAIESQAKVCDPVTGWTCDGLDEPAKVDCDDYITIFNATDTIENYRVSKSTCNLNDVTGLIDCAGSSCCYHETLVCDDDSSDGFAVGYPAFVAGEIKFCLFNGIDYSISDSPEVNIGDDLTCTGEDIDHDGFVDNNATYCHSNAVYQLCDFYVPNYAESINGDDMDVCVNGEVVDCFSLSPSIMIGCDEQFICLESTCVNNSDGKITGSVQDITIMFANITTIENLDLELENIDDLTIQQLVTFRDLKRTIIETEIDFSSEYLDFTTITLGTQNCTEGYGWTIVSGLPEVAAGTTKTMYVDAVNFSEQICIKDALTTTIHEISAGCDGVDEIYFDKCGTLYQTKVNNGFIYTCEKVTNDNGFIQYKITGLHHSAATELLGLAAATGQVPEFNGSSLLFGLLLVAIGIVVIRRKN